MKDSLAADLRPRILPAMIADTIPQIKTLSVARKRRLIAELLDELYGDPVREGELAKALAERTAHFRRNPGSARRWAKVKARLRARH